MGIGSGVFGFGVGYAAGMKLGDRPIRALGNAAESVRQGAASVSAAADRVRSTVGGVRPRTVDVREIREVMTAAPDTVGPDTTIRDAAQVMERGDIGNVLVVEGEQLRGIVTDRDLAVRGVAQGLDPATTTVAQVFTPSAVSIAPTATVQEAIKMMQEHDVRRLPVVESGRAIGIVSLGDLAVSIEPASLLADISAAAPNN